MNYELTQHAKDMLQERGIALEWFQGAWHVPYSPKYVGLDESWETVCTWPELL